MALSFAARARGETLAAVIARVCAEVAGLSEAAE
jgi:MoxR-like ATPase